MFARKQFVNESRFKGVFFDLSETLHACDLLY